MKSQENWRAIPGYEGRYCVSDLGNVMSMDFLGTGLPGLMKGTENHSGYLTLELSLRGKKKRFHIPRLVMLAFIGPRPPNAQINHIDGDKKNNKLSNLEYCSRSENIRHAYSIGLMQVGEDHSKAKLTSTAVIEIRRLHAGGSSANALGRQFGITGATVRQIVSGRTWRHVALQ